MKAVYDEYGYLQGEQIREWNNTVKWNAFQKNWLAEHKEKLKKQTALPFSQDDGLRLFHIVDNERVLLKENVKARLYGDRFELSDDDGFAMSFNWKTISKIGMFRSRSLYFTYRNERYELQKSSGFSLLKYFSLWRILTDKELF